MSASVPPPASHLIYQLIEGYRAYMSDRNLVSLLIISKYLCSVYDYNNDIPLSMLLMPLGYSGTMVETSGGCCGSVRLSHCCGILCELALLYTHTHTHTHTLRHFFRLSCGLGDTIKIGGTKKNLYHLI